jgi:hypothetical protein
MESVEQKMGLELALESLELAAGEGALQFGALEFLIARM